MQQTRPTFTAFANTDLSAMVSAGGTTTPQAYWLQNAAIFAGCANLFSTALASVGFVTFLIFFAWSWFSAGQAFLNKAYFPQTVALAIASYIGWQVVGLSYTDVPISHGLKSIFTERKIVYILPLALVFVCQQSKVRFLWSFLLTCAVGVLISFMVQIPALGLSSRFNAAAVFHSHATQGMAFAMAAFLAVWLGHHQSRLTIKSALYLLGVLFSLNIAFITHGRSGYLVFLVLIVWWFVLRLGLRGSLVGGLVSAAFAASAFYISPVIAERMVVGFNEIRSYETATSETSLGRRMVMYTTTVEMIKQNPIVGVGTGSYAQSFSSIAAARYTGWRATPFHDPHNQYLFVLAENGVIGLIIFLSMLFVIWRQCYRGDVYGKMAAGCILAWCATSFFSGHFRTFPEGHLIAFVVGILMGSTTNNRAGVNETSNSAIFPKPEKP